MNFNENQSSPNPFTKKSLVIGILCNPASGRIKRCLEELKLMLNTVPAAVYHEAVTADEIHKAIELLSERQVNILILIGGDGTVHTALTCLFRDWGDSRPVVAVIPGGTTNMTALDLGMRKKPLDYIPLLAAGVEAPHSLNLTTRDVLEIKHGDNTRLFGMFFGCGLIPHGVEYFHETIGKSGVTSELSGGLVMLKYVLGLLFRPGTRPVTPVTIIRGGGNIDYNYCLVAFITTLDRLLLGIRPYRRIEKGRLFFTIINNNMKSVWGSVLSLLAGKGGVNTGEYIKRKGDRIDLLIDGKFIVDGELYNASRSGGTVSISRAGSIEFLVL